MLNLAASITSFFAGATQKAAAIGKNLSATGIIAGTSSGVAHTNFVRGHLKSSKESRNVDAAPGNE